jgi:translation elongation factor P/translation initiation factor 5A
VESQGKLSRSNRQLAESIIPHESNICQVKNAIKINKNKSQNLYKINNKKLLTNNLQSAIIKSR